AVLELVVLSADAVGAGPEVTGALSSVRELVTGDVTVGTEDVLSLPTFRLCPGDRLLDDSPFHSIRSSTFASYCLAMEKRVCPCATWWVIQPPEVIVVEGWVVAVGFCSAGFLEGAASGLVEGALEVSTAFGASAMGSVGLSATPCIIKAWPTLRSFPFSAFQLITSLSLTM